MYILIVKNGGTKKYLKYYRKFYKPIVNGILNTNNIYMRF